MRRSGPMRIMKETGPRPRQPVEPSEIMPFQVGKVAESPLKYVSIRAPEKGATRLPHPTPQACLVSIRAPEKGATREVA